MPESHALSVNLNPRHTFSKHPQPRVRLLAGLGVEGDAHCGAAVRHVYLRRRNPAAPNRTQVHLLAAELLDDLNRSGFDLHPGDLGENITTRGIDLIALPSATRLHLGPEAVLELTGLRTPCVQMNRLRPGLMAASFAHDSLSGRKRPRAGVMAVVLRSGVVNPGASILLELPPQPHTPLHPV